EISAESEVLVAFQVEIAQSVATIIGRGMALRLAGAGGAGPTQYGCDLPLIERTRLRLVTALAPEGNECNHELADEECMRTRAHYIELSTRAHPIDGAFC